MYAAGIYNNGTLRGQAITLDSGASTNISRGTIVADSATGNGGTIELLGDKVGILGGTVDASGKTGGGTVFIGGNARGVGSLPNSQFVTIGSGASVSADATGSGNGGKVVVFAEDSTRVYGSLSATGAGGGHGGYIETSGKQHFDISMTPITGAGGTWLIDPNDIDIQAGGSNTNIGNGTPFLQSVANATLGVDLIGTALVSGTAVTVTTSTGNITWHSSANLTYSTSSAIHTLTLSAGGFINIQADIQPTASTDALTLVLVAGTSGPATSKNVSISGNVSLNNGTLWSTGVDFVNTGKINSNVGINILHTGDVSIKNDLNATSSGEISIAGNSAVQSVAGNITTGTLALQTTGDDGSGHGVKLTRSGNSFTTLGISSTGASASADVVTSGGANLTTIAALTGVPSGVPAFGSTQGVTTSNGLVHVQTGGSISLNNPVNGGTANVTVVTTSGNITTVGGSNPVTGGNITLTSAGGIGTAAIPVVVANSANASFSSAGDIFINSSALSLPMTFSTDATPRTIGIIGTAVTVGTNIVAGANNTLIVDGTTSVTLNAGTTISGGTVYVTSPGDIALAGNVTGSATALLLGNSISQSAGIINAPTLGVEATGATTGVSINLGQANTVGTFAVSGAGTSGTISLLIGGNATAGNVAGFAPAGFTAFTALTQTSGNGHNVAIAAQGNLTLSNNIAAGSGGNVTLTANGTSSMLVESGGVISGDNVTATVTGGIGSSSTPVQVATLGNVSLTTSAANHTGDIFAQVNNAFHTANLTVSTVNTSAQLMAITANGTMTVDSAFSSGTGAGTDDVSLKGTTLIVTTGNSTSGGNVTLATTGGVLKLQGDVTGASGDTVTLTSVGGGINQTGGTVSAASGTITINATGGGISLNGTAVSAAGGAVTLTTDGRFPVEASRHPPLRRARGRRSISRAIRWERWRRRAMAR